MAGCIGTTPEDISADLPDHFVDPMESKRAIDKRTDCTPPVKTQTVSAFFLRLAICGCFSYIELVGCRRLTLETGRSTHDREHGRSPARFFQSPPHSVYRRTNRYNPKKSNGNRTERKRFKMGYYRTNPLSTFRPDRRSFDSQPDRNTPGRRIPDNPKRRYPGVAERS